MMQLLRTFPTAEKFRAAKGKIKPCDSATFPHFGKVTEWQKGKSEQTNRYHSSY